ncbi:NrfD/PsrC family molybdoenzyme membrane anchor subunit [Roseicella aquatilis]|uniref:Tetrathionate reductase n=1 Tax=Roseicella aquatilis TaxID=2527868 RepID=A0A4R4D9Y1_9PROT|nr:NrfD/PsrC family molybdoenzyme membrane anchor subunit [Roseicella aquatilis]TCZ57308.1 tetrathionate reductase [Roseicella aquatilis]
MNPVVEVLNVTREAAWLPWAVQYFFLIGLSVGCFLLTLPGFALGRPAWLRLARLALIGALVCGFAAPVALLADLHQPGRFWRFYAHPNLHSWMAWGAFFIPGYVGGLCLYAWAALRPGLAAAPARVSLLGRAWRLAALPWLPRMPRLLPLAAAWTTGFAALVLLYTGMEVMVVRARPLWNTPFLPVQFAVTALAGAIGLVLVLDRLLPPRDRGMEVALNRLLALSLAATLAVGGAWLATGLLGLDAAHAAALASVAGSPEWRFAALWAGLAAAVPAALALWRPAGTGWLSGLIALHAAWMFRWTVFIGGQTVPKSGAGFYAYHLPLGHDGLLGILGTGGLCLFLLIALTALLPWEAAGPARAAAPAAAPVAPAAPGRA